MYLEICILVMLHSTAKEVYTFIAYTRPGFCQLALIYQMPM